MSIHITAPVWKRARKVKGEALLVLLTLADCADENGYCYPSLPHIADMARIEPTSASKILKRLEADGYVLVVRGNGRGHRSQYVVFPDGNAPRIGSNEAAAAMNEAESNHQNGPSKRAKKVAPKTTFNPSKVAPETSFEERGLTKDVSDAVTYKDEPSLNKPSLIEPSVEEEERAQEIEPPLPPPPQIPTLIFDAIESITGQKPNPQFPRDRAGIAELKKILVNEGCQTEAAAAEMIRAVCSHWPKHKTPPHLSQIVSDWRRMKLTKQNKENQNDGLSTSAAPAAYLTPKQQAAVNRERDRQDLINRGR